MKYGYIGKGRNRTEYVLYPQQVDDGTRLSLIQAFRVAKYFLATEFEITHSDEVADLLGYMMLATDGYPFDGASWHDWKEAVAKVLAEDASAEP
jgi:uncharacterized protein YegL